MAEAPAECPGSGEHVVADGTRVLVRPVVASDRFEIAQRYLELSSESRRSRFIAPPDQLSAEDLDYLTNVDYHDHFAIAAFALDEPGEPGIAIARYVRDTNDPALAEVAITVVDRFQRRGIGTMLARILADIAVEHDVRTFVYFALWSSDEMIEVLRSEGARVTSDEPGVARIELDLPAVEGGLPESTIHHILASLTRRFHAWLESGLPRMPAGRLD